MLAAAHMNINSSNFSFKERKSDFNTPKMDSPVKTPEERAKKKKKTCECLSHKKNFKVHFSPIRKAKSIIYATMQK